MLKSVFCSSDMLGVLEAKGKMSKNIWEHSLPYSPLFTPRHFKLPTKTLKKDLLTNFFES